MFFIISRLIQCRQRGPMAVETYLSPSKAFDLEYLLISINVNKKFVSYPVWLCDLLSILHFSHWVLVIVIQPGRCVQAGQPA
jgi:hypothetical protein